MFGQSCLWCHFIILALYSSCVPCLLHTRSLTYCTMYTRSWYAVSCTVVHAVHDLLLVFVSHLSHFMECILLVFVGSCQFFVATDIHTHVQRIQQSAHSPTNKMLPQMRLVTSCLRLHGPALLIFFSMLTTQHSMLCFSVRQHVHFSDILWSCARIQFILHIFNVQQGPIKYGTHTLERTLHEKYINNNKM